MKQWFLSAVCSLIFISPALARLGDPIDTRARADVSGKMADLPTVPMNTVAFPNQNQPTSDLSRKRHRTRNLPMQSANTSTVSTPIVDTEIRSTPLSNFGPKRASASSQRARTETMPTETFAAGKAPINDRVIRANTPAGEAELVEQLKRRK